MATEIIRLLQHGLRARVIELWNRTLRLSRRTPKTLRLCESLPLGERRFVAVVEFERKRFLVGGTSSSLVLLSRMEDCGDDNNEQVEEREIIWALNTEGKMLRRGDERC